MYKRQVSLDDGQYLFGGHLNVDRDDIDTGGQDILCRTIVKLEGGSDEITAFLVDGTFLLDDIENFVKLIFCDGRLLRIFEKTGDSIADFCEDKADRRHHLHEETQKARTPQCRRFRECFCKTLRQHFTGKKHDDRHDDRGVRNIDDTPQYGCQIGHEGCKGYVHYVVADENCAQGFIIIL